ncbi:17151_t:CDS:1 [Gigaspora rosea]|nr:17151_t:CDS:1 [Gigaspora rosea]
MILKKTSSIEEVISRLEDIEFDQVFQNHDYVPEISFRNNNASVSRKEACLTVIKGSPQNLYFFLPVGETFIGRNNLNHIIIKDQEVDKKHANIRSSQGKVEITSLSSGSGIFVNGDKLLFRIPYTLERNDKIKMGRCIFQYLPPGEYENRIDQLLPIYNTDYLRKSLNNKFENAKKNNKYLSLLFFDLDHFGNINKQNSHEAGDYALIELSKLIQKEYVRAEDIFARYGGDSSL